MTPQPLRSSTEAGRMVDRLHNAVRRRTAPLEQVAALVPRGGVAIELGCGQGLLARALADRTGQVVAVDYDVRKCRLARELLAGRSNVQVVQDDIEHYLALLPTGTVSAVVLSDTLSAMPFDAQRRVLAASVRCIAPGGVLVAKVVDTAPWWKATIARIIYLLVFRLAKLSVTSDDRVHYQHHRVYAELFRELGLDVSVVMLHRGLRYLVPHVAIVGRAPAAPSLS
jgi:SAM-dependent methyltransferase